MKKKLLALVFVLGALVAAWAIVREKAGRENAVEYIKAREIPTYHLLSLHSEKDRTLGFCEPCGAKFRDVVREEMHAELDKAKKAVTGK